jgi:hypothetical protein
MSLSHIDASAMRFRHGHRLPTDDGYHAVEVWRINSIGGRIERTDLLTAVMFEGYVLHDRLFLRCTL